MSVHLKAGEPPLAKTGRPGHWSLAPLEGSEVMSTDNIEEVLATIEHALSEEGCFVEQDYGNAKVYQLQNIRTVVTFPPLSGDVEITLVRPVVQLSFDEYPMEEKLKERLLKRAEGVLVAGAPGNGKTTFAEALLGAYYKEGRIIKTIEVPRDLRVPKGVTQYSLSHSSTNTIRDLLLLTRPDYTFFDEIRNPEDFHLFKDLRLTGIGMVGVIHAEKPIDAIQRFIGKIELGLISHVIDTVVFIKEGGVKAVYDLKYAVKTPIGMNDEGLARPVIIIRDFYEEKELFEIYTFGDQVVVIDVQEVKANQRGSSPLLEHGVAGLRKALEKMFSFPFAVKALGERSIEISVEKPDIPKIIGKGGSRIRELEQALGVHIDVREMEGQDPTKLPKLKHEVVQGKKGKTEIVLHEDARKVILYVDPRRQYEYNVPKSGRIKVQKGMVASVVQKGNFLLYKKA